MTSHSPYRNRYSVEFKAAAVNRVEQMIKNGQAGYYSIVAREVGVAPQSITTWHRASQVAAENGHKKATRPTPHPHLAVVVADEATEAKNEAVAVADLMANEAVSDHTSGGVHPTLTAYEDIAEQYDHQKSVVNTLHGELAVHTERLAELERQRADAKKALVEMVNSL